MGYQPAHLRAACLRQLSGAISRPWTEQRKKTFLILDDAQTIEESLLEDLRLMTNFEFDSSEPLALLFIGHPSLQNHLACSSLPVRQLHTCYNPDVGRHVRNRKTAVVHPLRLGSRSGRTHG